ncbi:DUF6571 family protein [Actinomyces wuliandei]|uniref:DUF6571 family protein n=1 Tax=Actinomyces wuliandei TaxID=2057743 RepID=UPI0015D64A67|nr:DUF6571 family protein [Actinomyces wuliandei]
MPATTSSSPPGTSSPVGADSTTSRSLVRRAVALVAGRWPRPRPRVVAAVVAACLVTASTGWGGWWWVRVHDPLTIRLTALANDPHSALDWLAPRASQTDQPSSTPSAPVSQPTQDQAGRASQETGGDEGGQGWQPSAAAVARWEELGSRAWGSQGLHALARALAATTQLREEATGTGSGPGQDGEDSPASRSSASGSGREEALRAAWAAAQGLEVLADHATRLEAGTGPALARLLAGLLEDVEQATGRASGVPAWEPARPVLMPGSHDRAVLTLLSVAVSQDTGLTTLLEAVTTRSSPRLQAVIDTHPAGVLGHDTAFDTEVGAALHDDGVLIGLTAQLATTARTPQDGNDQDETTSLTSDGLDPRVSSLADQARRRIEHTTVALLANNDRLDQGAYYDVHGEDYATGHEWMREDHTIDTASVLTSTEHGRQFEDWLRDASIPEVTLKNTLAGGIQDGQHSASHH